MARAIGSAATRTASATLATARLTVVRIILFFMFSFSAGAEGPAQPHPCLHIYATVCSSAPTVYEIEQTQAQIPLRIVQCE